MLTPRWHAPGFTLVEMLLGLIIGAIVGTALITLTVRHEHLAFALEQIMESRRALREGTDVLEYDLRSTVPARDAIYDMGDTYVDFRLETGLSVLCALDSLRTTVLVPARTVRSPNLTSWIVAPETGDTTMVYAAHPDADSARWYRRAIASAPAGGRSCPTEFMNGVPLPALALRLETPVPSDVTDGAVLRFFRRARYELYKAADGGWYLGFRDCLATRATPCATIQPVSGPYARGGLQLRYVDSTGSRTADPSHVARIEGVFRAESAARLHLAGIAAGVFSDSVLFTISPRR